MKTLLSTLLCFSLVLQLSAQNHWKTIPSGTTHDLLSISFANEQIGYISGKDSLLLKTTDGGNNWQILNHSGLQFDANNYTDIVDIEFVNDMTGYAIVSNYANHQYAGRLYKTLDGGLSWAPANDTINIAARKSYFFEEDNGFLMGSAFFAGKVIARMEGGLWVNYTNFAFGAESFLYGIDFFDTLYGIVGGDGGYFYRTLDGGHTWDTIYSGRDSTIYGIRFLDEQTIVAATGHGNQSVIISRDSGITWQYTSNNMSFVDPIMESITSCKGDSIIAVGYTTQVTPSGYVHWLENGQWQQQAFEPALHAVTTQSDSVAFAVGDSGLIITNGDGPPSGINGQPTLQEDLRLFPNPAGSVIHLRYRHIEVRDLLLTDISGKAVRSYPPASKVLNISGLASGCYLLQIRTRQGAIHRKVVVK